MFWNSNSTKMNPWISILVILFKYYNVLMTLYPSHLPFSFIFSHSFCISFLSSRHSTSYTPRTHFQFMFIVFIEQYGLHNPWTLFLHINSCQLYSSMVHALWSHPFGILFLFWYVHVLCHAFCIFVFFLTIFTAS